MFTTDSFLKRSGQCWKIWLFLLLLLIGSVLLLIGFTQMVSPDPDYFVSFVVSGSCLGAMGLIWLSVSVRCKNCKSRLGWKAISEQIQDSWFFWLLKTPICPVCKNDGLWKTGQKGRRVIDDPLFYIYLEDLLHLFGRVVRIMQKVPIKPFLIGFVFASFLCALLVFAFNFESRTPNYAGLDARYDVYEAAVTENQSLYDSETNQRLLWTPGNPKVKVAEVKEISPGRWQIIVEKIY